MGHITDKNVVKKIDLNDLLANSVPAVIRFYEPKEVDVATGLVGLPGGVSMVSAAKSYGSAAAPAIEPQDYPFLKLFEQVDRFAQMQDDWDGFGAEVPNETARYRAKSVLTVLMRANFAPKRIAPSVENGIGLSFRSGRKSVDIECSNDGSIMAVQSYGTGEPEVWTIEPEHIEQNVDHIVSFLSR